MNDGSGKKNARDVYIVHQYDPDQGKVYGPVGQVQLSVLDEHCTSWSGGDWGLAAEGNLAGCTSQRLGQKITMSGDVRKWCQIFDLTFENPL
jgi:hypothetical protein